MYAANFCTDKQCHIETYVSQLGQDRMQR